MSRSKNGFLQLLLGPPPHPLSRVQKADVLQKARRLVIKDHPGGKVESISQGTFSWVHVYAKCRSRIPRKLNSYEVSLKSIRSIEWT